MKILLVDILRSGLEEIWPAAEHSIGLMYLSSVLKKRFGNRINIKIWSLISLPNHPEEDKDNMLKKLEEVNPDVVGVRSLTISKDCIETIAKTVKGWNKDCILIAGGPYATDDPGDALNGGLVNACVIGEGEDTIIDIIQSLFERTPISEIPGIAFQRYDRLVRTPARELINDLDAIPFPDYSEIDLNEFSNRFLNFAAKISSPHANIMTSRGCPYRCAYCHNILGKKFRARSAENVFEEICFIHDQYGITDFQVIDDIFNLDMDRAKKICDYIIKSNMKLTLAFPNAIRADRVDEELVEKMARAGTKFTAIAIESASPRIQKLINKNLDLDKAFTAIDLFSNAGVITRGFFMMGFPTETEKEVIKTIEYAKKSSLCGATFFTVVYYPGTNLSRLAQSYGYFTEEKFEVQRDYVQVSEGPYEFSLERLIELKKKAIFEFAFTRERINNALKIMPPYFSEREINGLFMAYVVSSQAKLDDIKDKQVRQVLKRHFIISERFSKKREFYV